jgi:methyl-accepting chemotaxis protein
MTPILVSLLRLVGGRRARGTAGCEAVTLDAAPAEAVAEPNGPGLPESLLGRWLELSELQRRAFLAMTNEIAASSSTIECSATDLSDRFQKLADCARDQTDRVEAVIAVAGSIAVRNEKVSLAQATAFIEDVLVKMTDAVLAASGNGMRLVDALEAVRRDVSATGASVAQLQRINQRIRILALNAAIEAARSGQEGSAFAVIAREIRALATETDGTAAVVNERVGAVSASLTQSQAVLRELATADMSGHVSAKERLSALLQGMVAQGNALNNILADTAGASADLAATITPLVIGLQFQDRTSQQLSHVIDGMKTLAELAQGLREATFEAVGEPPGGVEIDQSLLDRMTSTQTLGTVQKRFLAQLVQQSTGTGAVGRFADDRPADDCDIDLF